jgi:hypothetical protein
MRRAFARVFRHPLPSRGRGRRAHSNCAKTLPRRGPRTGSAAKAPGSFCGPLDVRPRFMHCLLFVCWLGRRIPHKMQRLYWRSRNVYTEHELTNAGAPGRDRDAMDACPGDGHAAARPRGWQAASLRYPECTFPFRGSPPRLPVPGSDPASLILCGRAPAPPLPCRLPAAPFLPSAVVRRERAIDSSDELSIDRRLIDPYFGLSIHRQSVDPYFAPSIDRRPIDSYFGLSMDRRLIDSYFALLMDIWPIYSYFALSILISRHRLIDGSSILILGCRSLFWVVMSRTGCRTVLSSGYKTPLKM